MTVILNRNGECILCALRDYINQLEKFVEKTRNPKTKEKFEKFNQAWIELLEWIDAQYGLTYTI